LEIVERYWSKDEAIRAKEEFERVFKDKGMPDEIPVKNIVATDEAKTTDKVGLEEVTPKVTWLPQVMKDIGLAKSTSEAIRLIKQGGVKLNGSTVTDTDMMLQQGEYLIQVGKRRFHKVIVE
jgi:tyrosyl-tRNA synthetase